jgi:hypothetical protein
MPPSECTTLLESVQNSCLWMYELSSHLLQCFFKSAISVNLVLKINFVKNNSGIGFNFTKQEQIGLEIKVDETQAYVNCDEIIT